MYLGRIILNRCLVVFFQSIKQENSFFQRLITPKLSQSTVRVTKSGQMPG